MNYEKAYKEALERAKNLHDNHPLGQPPTWITCEKIFPVLKESDDDRIRKVIICGMNALKEQHKETFASIPINDCIAWLEKQKEIKTEDFGEFINKLSKQFPQISFAKLSRIAVRVKNWLEKQGENKPAEWSKEDEQNLNFWLDNNKSVDSDKRNWLRSIKDRVQPQPNYVEQDTETHDLWVYIREWNEKFGRLPKDEDELASCIDYVMKRQKPAWSEKHIADVFAKVGLARIVREQGNDQLTNAVQSAMIELSKQQKPAEWSEEDKAYIDYSSEIIGFLKNYIKAYGCTAMNSWVDWLVESLKDRVQPHHNH